ncbi:MAG: hypothetical protein JXA73_07180 [Acidobacteria bacterium]|nr:hypothetical protein [Acidobacteriota bacterium]
MAKIKAGIELPIIPEDFIDSEEDLTPDMVEAILEWAYRSIQDGTNPDDQTPMETLFAQYSKI